MSKLLATTAAVAALFIAPAFALDISNEDAVEYQLHVQTQGSDSVDYKTVAPGKSLKGVCKEACTIRLIQDTDYLSVTYGDKARIKDGHIQVMPRS